MSTSTSPLQRALFWVVAGAVYGILLIPVFIVILTSFTTASFPRIPQDGATLDWYWELFGNRALRDALWTSFIVAAVSSVLSGALGTITAFGFVRSEFPYKEQLATVMLLPLMISPVITGLAIIQYASRIGLSSGYNTLIIGHIVLTLPYVFLIIRSRLLTFDQKYEEASQVLGANSVETTFNVTLPIIFPSIISAVVIAFVVSFGEFTATQFLVSVDQTTVPVIIYTQLRAGLSPEISALATLLVVIMLLGAVISKIALDRSASAEAN